MASRTGDKKVHNHCNLCKYFHLEVQPGGGGWLEICEVTGGRTIWDDEGFNNCQFMEDKELMRNDHRNSTLPMCMEKELEVIK